MEAISRLVPPENRSQLRGFLGLAGYYRQFVHRYAAHARPLTELLKEDTAWVWGEQQEAAFQLLKDRLQTAPVLALPAPDRPYTLFTDFCGASVSAVLE